MQIKRDIPSCTRLLNLADTNLPAVLNESLESQWYIVVKLEGEEVLPCFVRNMEQLHMLNGFWVITQGISLIK